jgi:hypothetical protein
MRSGATNNNNDNNNSKGGVTGRISPVDDDGSSERGKKYLQLLQWPKPLFYCNRLP